MTFLPSFGGDIFAVASALFLFGVAVAGVAGVVGCVCDGVGTVGGGAGPFTGLPKN